jgi:2-hydroxychromene-2-carboxylate isomerase
VGDLVSLTERIADRSRPVRDAVAFFFAPGCPISYLVAERAERTLGEVEWIPILPLTEAGDDLVVEARGEALALRLPLQMPENPLADPRPLTRAACLATERGVGARFGLAAARLIFCGGYEIDDPQVILEAAHVAGMPSEDAREAAEDDRFDPALEATAAGLARHGVLSAPVVRVGRRWFQGLQALPGAAIATAVGELAGAPSQPVG